jgi:hypothetical protein
MRGAIPPLPQYAIIFPVKAQGQIHLHLICATVEFIYVLLFVLNPVIFEDLRRCSKSQVDISFTVALRISASHTCAGSGSRR